MESSCKFVVVLRLLTLLMFCGCVMGDVNSGSIYSLLSHVIFEMKANFEKVEKRMEIMEDRLARVETVMSTTAAKRSAISTIGPNHEKELDEVTNSQALAIRKTLFAEKKILRAAMHSFAVNFSDFKSEILTEMSDFSKALNMDISTINSSVESKADNLITRLDSSSIALAKEVIELTSSVNSTASEIRHALEEMRSNIDGVDQRITAVENVQKIDGGWNAWAAWTSCTATCNSGLKTRQRQCVNPRPSGGGQNCDGAPIEVVECNQNSCPKIDGGWNAWTAWTSCTATCNSGLKTRQRQCAYPRPSGGGQYCDDAPIEVVECNQNPCPRTKSSFTATKNTSHLSSDILSFSSVLLNEGSNFDSVSGTFTCQHSGLYFFTATIIEGGSGDNSILCNIRQNDSKKVMLRYQNGKDATNTRTLDGFGEATGSATLHLTNGDRVNVWCSKAAISASLFSGFLIAEDP